MKQILVVDDDTRMLDLIARSLSEYTVTVVPGGHEALLTATRGARFDLVITDYLMQSMMGDELLGRLRERHPGLRALVITAHDAILAREMPEWWDREAHLAKPFTVSDLKDAVFQLIGGPDSLPETVPIGRPLGF